MEDKKGISEDALRVALINEFGGLDGKRLYDAPRVLDGPVDIIVSLDPNAPVVSPLSGQPKVALVDYDIETKRYAKAQIYSGNFSKTIYENSSANWTVQELAKKYGVTPWPSGGHNEGGRTVCKDEGKLEEAIHNTLKFTRKVDEMIDWIMKGHRGFY